MKLPIQIPRPKKKDTAVPKPGQKLQASARRSSAAMADDYEEEPTMRLSSALFVVLILHLVAIGGVMAFTKFKESHAHTPAAKIQPAEQETTAQPAANVTSTKPQPADTEQQQAPAKKIVSHPADDSPAVPAVKDSGEIYTVVKGDNPVTIARHFKVKYDDLISLNHITDARRLRIGQKLRIPVKAKPHVTENND